MNKEEEGSRLPTRREALRRIALVAVASSVPAAFLSCSESGPSQFLYASSYPSSYPSAYQSGYMSAYSSNYGGACNQVAGGYSSCYTSMYADGYSSCYYSCYHSGYYGQSCGSGWCSYYYRDYSSCSCG
jgi:hypothetical protein